MGLTNAVEQVANLSSVAAKPIATALAIAPDPQPQGLPSTTTARISSDSDPYPKPTQTRLSRSYNTNGNLDVYPTSIPQIQQPPQSARETRSPTLRSQSQQDLESPQVSQQPTASPPPIHHAAQDETVQAAEPAAKRRKPNYSHQLETELGKATDHITESSAQDVIVEAGEPDTIYRRLDNSQAHETNSEEFTSMITESVQHEIPQVLLSATRKRTEKSTQHSAISHDHSASTKVQETLERGAIPAVQLPAKQRKSNISQRLQTKRGGISDTTPSNVEQTFEDEGTVENERIIEDGHRDPSLDAAAQADSSSQRPKPKPKQRITVEKAKAKNHIKQAAEAVVAAAINSGRKRTATTRTPKTDGQAQRRRRRKRISTPEDAETVEIDPTSLKMSDLCRDLHYGKKSVRSKEIRIFEIEEAAKKQAQKEREERGEGSEEDENNEGPRRAARMQVQSNIQQTVPQMEIVNGMLVLVEGSNRVDRHAGARANQAFDEQAITHESSLSRRTNQRTNMKISKRENWDEEMTELFYDGLRMFGTDFGMIARMFPGRSRRTIKLKFTKEEKVNEARINQTLIHERKLVDMEEFSKLSKTTYDDPSELERDMEEDRRRLEEEQANQKDALDEIVRQRENEVAAESAAFGGDFAKENEAVAGEGHNTGKKAGKVKDPKNKAKSRAKSRPGQPPNSEGTVEVLGAIA